MKKDLCTHCATLIPSGRGSSEFCCQGCEFVYHLIHELDLSRFYELKDKKTAPLVGLFRKKSDLTWLENQNELQRGSIKVQIQGIQCAACVWMIQELARKEGSAQVSINTLYGVMKIQFDPSQFDLFRFLDQVQKLGYVITPYNQTSGKYGYRSLLLRTGICAALTMNIMMLSASLYTGLTSTQDSILYAIVTNANFVIATLAMIIGGSYFITRAFISLRNKLLHFDLPIAVGMLLAYSGSVYIHFFQQASQAYFDTVTVFITLMLLGRLIQERLIEKNKSAMISKQSVHEFTIRTIGAEKTWVDQPMSQIKKDDKALLFVGSLAPVDMKNEEDTDLEVDMSWISGESQPKVIKPNETIPAGATLLGPHSAKVTSLHQYDDTQLAKLLSPQYQQDTLPRFWSLIAKYYVLAVLMLSFIGFVYWYMTTGAVAAFSVAISIAVVTCPCSLGIAIPLAKTLVMKRLMHEGVFIQRVDAIDDILLIKNIAFDKTGTITLSDLIVKNQNQILALSDRDQIVLYNAVAQSYHPASRAIFDFLRLYKLPILTLDVQEQVGKGILCTYEEHSYFIGRKSIHENQRVGTTYVVDYYKDQELLLRIELDETIQDYMQEVIQECNQDYKEVFIISGDYSSKVEKVASYLGIDKKHVFSQCNPQEKAQIMTKLSDDATMYIGDGLNDQLALSQAKVSALSLHGQLQLSQKSDLYFLSVSMRWLPKLFTFSKALRKTVIFNLTFLVIYNVIAVGLAMMGMITPLICAIIMPVSSLFVISVTTRNIKKLS